MNSCNPWLNIPAEDYEMHMSDHNVFQLQTLNAIVKSQIQDYEPNTLAIFGVATGNGLEHIRNAKVAYAVDINDQYLIICKEKFGFNKNIKFIKLDLQNEDYEFEPLELAICNLILEYLDEDKSIKMISSKIAEYGILSLVFQVNQDDGYISQTQYSNVFSVLNNIHHDINEDNILRLMEKNTMIKFNKEEYLMPNKKKLVRIDFKKKSSLDEFKK